MTEPTYQICSSCGGSGIGSTGDVSSDCYSCSGEGTYSDEPQLYQFKPVTFEVEEWGVEYDKFYTLTLADGESFHLDIEVFEALVMPADMEHFISFNDTGFAIQHPLICRPKLLECQVELDIAEISQDWADCPVEAYGTYRVVLSGDESYDTVDELADLYHFVPLHEPTTGAS